MTHRAASDRRRRSGRGGDASRPRLGGRSGSCSASRSASASLRIDRLEAQGVEWFAAPGLLPAILGVVHRAVGRADRRCAHGAPASLGAAMTSRPAPCARRVLLTLLRRASASRSASSAAACRSAWPQALYLFTAHRAVAVARAARATAGAARAARSLPRSPSASASRCRSSSSSCSSCACHEATRRDARRPAPARALRWPASSSRGRSLYALGATLVGILIGCMPGLSATLGDRAADHADDQDGAQRRDPDPDLRLRRHDLRRQPHGDPAQHPRHRGQRRRVPRRPPARAAGPGRPRDGHRHHRLGGRLAVRRACASRCSRRCSAKSR